MNDSERQSTFDAGATFGLTHYMVEAQKCREWQQPFILGYLLPSACGDHSDEFHRGTLHGLSLGAALQAGRVVAA